MKAEDFVKKYFNDRSQVRQNEIEVEMLRWLEEVVIHERARIAALEEVVREFLTVENTLPLDMDGYSICQFCEFDNGIDRMNQHELNCIYIKARAVLEGR